MTNAHGKDRELWTRFRARAAMPTSGPHAAPGDDMLAAWLDGRLDEAASAQMELWLADDPSAIAFVAAMRADPDGANVPPPAVQAVRRAQALVPAHGTGRAGWLPGLFARLFSPAAGAALAAMLVAAVGGFELGAATFTDIDAVDDEIAAEIWPADNVTLDEETG